MATFTFGVSPSASNGQGTYMGDFSRFTDYEKLVLSGTKITLTEGQDGTGLIFGTGFSVGINGPILTFPSGTITGLRLAQAGSTFVDVTGLNLSLTAFTDLIKANNDAGLLQLILSGNDKITGTKFQDTLLGGAGNDEIKGLEGADMIFGQDGADRLFGGGQADVLYGDAGKDYSVGGLGNDFVSGDDGADTLFGNAGNDTLLGGKATDVLTGGAGADTFAFLIAPVSNGVDVISDFVSGVDRIGLDPAAYGIPVGLLANSSFRLGTAAIDGDDRIIYHKATGKLYFDADGAGGVGQIQIANLGAGTTLVASDIAGILLF